MARRGFFAELNRQTKIAARNAARSQREAERNLNANTRRREQAQREGEKARKKDVKEQDARNKQLEKEAASAYVASREADVEERNLLLNEAYSEIDSLLESTLSVDDYVDLDSLRLVALHPPFDRPELESPISPPKLPIFPDEPVMNIPAPPSGLSALFGKKKYSQGLETAKTVHKAVIEEWKRELKRLEGAHQKAVEEHASKELQRRSLLDEEQARYAEECKVRDEEVAQNNMAVDKLAADLGYGVVEAVEEYVSIVLSNSVYPDHFPVSSDYAFDPENAELRLSVLIPAPDQISSVKAYKYNKSSNEVTETSLTQKACKDRYASATHQVALRTLHEIFEADRRGIIQTISLEVGTQTINPATGLEAYIPFIAVGSERSAFMEFDLSSVVPIATLNHLGAAISKNPHGLVPVDTSGVRRA